MTDKANQHRDEILGAAHEFYTGKTGGDAVAQRIQTFFSQAINDGTARELFQELRNTRDGQANVDIDGEHKYGNKVNLDESSNHILIIERGFWEQDTISENAGVRFYVVTDLDNKSVKIIRTHSD